MTKKEKRVDWLKSCGALYLLILGVSLGFGIVLLPLALLVTLVGGVIYTNR